MKTIAILAAATALFAATSHTYGQAVIVADFNDSPVTPAVTTQYVFGAPTLTLSGSGVNPSGTTGTSFQDALNVSHSAGTAGSFGADAGSDNEVLLTFDSTMLSYYTLRFDYRSTSLDDFQFRIDSRAGTSGVFAGAGESSLVRDGNWHEFSILINNPDIFDAGTAQIRITTKLEGIRGNFAFDIDNPQLTAVPEPHHYAMLFGFGLVGFAILRRRQAGVSTRLPQSVL